MDAAQKLLHGIAALLWPFVALLVLLVFRPSITAIIESAKSRKFSLKIGGQELTMEEANKQQQNLIADLQAQVLQIQKQIGDATALADENSAKVSRLLKEPPLQRASSVLWVDDNPKNNSYFVQQLSNQGIKVDLAQSTSEGMALFNARHYDFVISDMGRIEPPTYNPEIGRIESGAYNPTAGISFLDAVRSKNADIPVVIFCSAQAAAKYSQEAIQHGADGVTSSPTVLFGMLNLKPVPSTI